MSRPSPRKAKFCNRARAVMDLDAPPKTGTCPARTVKMSRGKRGRNNRLEAVHCDLDAEHPLPHKNGSWVIPQALLVRTEEKHD